MTRYLVDMAILIDHLNGQPEARNTLTRNTKHFPMVALKERPY